MSEADTLHGQCSLCQGQTDTATYLKTDPAKNVLDMFFFHVLVKYERELEIAISIHFRTCENLLNFYLTTIILSSFHNTY
jgi:hypothetical protein